MAQVLMILWSEKVRMVKKMVTAAEEAKEATAEDVPEEAVAAAEEAVEEATKTAVEEAAESEMEAAEEVEKVAAADQNCLLQNRFV